MSERFINPQIAAIPPSGIRRFFNLAGNIKNAISLGIGEPDFVTPYHIREAMIESLLNGETQYTENRGLLSLRKEIAHYMEARHHLCYDPENEIVVTIGASEAIDIVMRATLRPGDEVLLPDPGYVSYMPCVLMCGAVGVPVRTYEKDEFQLTSEALEEKITDKTRAIVLSYPNNPTGGVMSEAYLRAVAEVAVRHDLLVFSDEIYNELVYGGEVQKSPAVFLGMRERTVTINGFSKAFAMTGHRIGYFCAPEAIADAALKIHQYTILCAGRSAQAAAEEALRRGREDGYQDIVTMRESYNQRRRLMHYAMNAMGLSCFEPRGAFYAFPCIASTGLSSEEFCARLMKEQGVICIPGNAFGESGEGYIRCCYATDVDKLKEAFKRMRVFLDDLREEKQ